MVAAAEGASNIALKRISSAPLFPSQRLLLAVIGFFGFVMVYACRVNLSVALVCMVRHDSHNQSIDLSTLPLSQRGTLDWPKSVQGVLLGSFFYGYIVTQVAGGWISERLGAKRVFTLTTAGAVLVTLATPLVAANGHVALLIALRVVLGACQVRSSNLCSKQSRASASRPSWRCGHVGRRHSSDRS